MKPLVLIAAMLLYAANTQAHAQYTGPSIAPSTVRALLADGKDDMAVTLQGRIVRHLGSDKYRFADSTGEISLEIDPKTWPVNMQVDDKTQVTVRGEYDKNLIGEPEVDVTSIEILQ